MANTQSVIEIVFNGIDNASGTAKNIAEGFGDLNSAVGDIAAPFEDLADKLAIAQVALLAIAGTMGTLAYKEAVEFESSLASLQKVMDENEGSARDFAAGLEDLGIQYGTNANLLVESAADFKAAGFSLDDSTKLVRLSLDLMIAGEISAAEATDVLKNSLGGFGIEGNKAVAAAQEIADTLNKIADISKGGFKELADGFAVAAPIAKLTGYNFQEVAAILSVVNDAGYKGAESARGLSSAWLSIATPTAQAAEAMKALGASLDSQGKPLKSIKDTIAEMLPVWDTYTQNQKAVAAAHIAGKEQAAKFVVAMDEMKTVAERVAIANATAGGSVETEVTIRLKTAEQQIKSTNESWRQFLRALGDEIKVNTTGLISSIGEIGLSFKKVIEGGGLDPLFNLLNPQLKGLEDLLRTVAANLPAAFADLDWSKLVDAFGAMGAAAEKALASLFGPMDLSTVDGLRQAIQNLLDTLAGIVKLTAGELGGDTFNGFLSSIRQLLEGFRDADPKIQEWIGGLLSAAKTVGIVSGALDPLNTAFLGIIALGPKLAGMGAGLAAFGAALTGPVGIALALASSAAAMILWLVPAEDINDYLWPDWITGKQGQTPQTALKEIADGFVALKNRTEEWLGIKEKIQAPVRIPVTGLDGVISEIARFEEEIQKNKNEYNAFLNDLEQPVPVKHWDGMISRMDELAGKTGDAKVEVQNLIRSIPEKGIIVKGDFAFDDEPIQNLKKTWDKDGNPVFSEIEKKTVKATGAFKAVTDKTKEAADALDKMIASGKLTTKEFIEITKNANDFKVKMEEIASNERIKNIEFAVSLKTAQLETDMERVKAAFASIDTTIQSTGDLLGSLFSDFASTNDRWKESKIEEQIDLENQRRQEALDIQKKLAEAEIARIEAQTASLNRGDALITITGDGLQTELEAFMWKILSKIRVRANAEFADYLLGLGVTP